MEGQDTPMLRGIGENDRHAPVCMEKTLKTALNHSLDDYRCLMHSQPLDCAGAALPHHRFPASGLASALLSIRGHPFTNSIPRYTSG